MTIVSDVEIRLRADIARLQQDLNRARAEVNGAINGMSQAVEKLKGLLGGLFAVGSIAALAHEVIAAQREFDKLNASLITATGSSENAAQAFTVLQRFAASTPYDLAQTTKAFIQLRQLGLTPSERALTAFGNVASAKSLELGQVVEAVADAATGEFERLKEAFGIISKQVGDNVQFTFQGTTTTVKKSADEIEKYLMRIGEVQFAGAMELQARTLDGAISALGDSWQGVLRTFSQGGFGDNVRSGVLQLTEALGDLADYFKAAGGEAKKNGEEVDKLGPLYQSITLVLRQLVIIATQVAFVFTALGRNVGAVAAASAAALTGNFADAATILKDRFSDLGDEWADVNKRIEAIDKAAAERRRIESLQAVTSWGDELEQYKILGDAKAQQTDAEKKAAAEALAFYTKTREASIDQLQVLQQERDGQAALSSEEKKRIEILNDLLKFGKNLTKQQRSDIEGWAESIPLLAEYNKQLAESKKLRTAREAEAQADVAAANAQTQSLQDQIIYYGLTEEAVLKLKAAEIQRGLDGGYIDDLDRQRMEGLLAATNEQITAQTKLSKMKSESTFWTGLESTARQTFLSIANGSKDTATRLKETFKNIFFDWLYQMTVKKWIIQIGTSISGTAGVSGIASAAGIPGASGGTSALSLISMGKSIYEGFSTGFLGLAGSLGTGVSSLGAAFGSEAIAAFGAGLQGGALGATTASAASGYGGTVAAGYGAAAAPWVGAAAGIAGGIYGGRALSGGYSAFGGSGNSTVNTGTAVGAAIGTIFGPLGTALGGLAGGLVGGALNRVFGYKSPTVEGQGIRGSIGANGIDAQMYTNILQKGGWLRSDKRSTQTSALDTQTDSAFDTTIKNMISSVKGFGNALGIEASTIDGYAKVFDLKLTGDAVKDNEALMGLINTVGDELSVKLVPGLAKFSLEGETLATTLQRVTANYVATDMALTAIGKTVGVVGVAGIEARERLIAAAGGLDALANGVSFFQANYLSEAEKIAPLQKQVAESLTALGMSSVKTNDQFKAAVQGVDVSTEAGAALFAQLLALAPAFKTVADYADNLAGVVRRSAADIRSERATLQNQLDQLIMTPAQLAEKARNAIDASNRALYDQIVAGQARLDRVTALNTETTAIQAVIDKSKAWISTLKDANNSLALSAQSPLTPLEKYEEARRQLEATLASARAGDAEAQSALSSIEQAFLAASQVVNAGDAKYASDYAMVINANKEAIAWASKQVTIDEQSLTALQRQVELLNNLTTSANTIAQLMAGDFSSYTANAGSTAVVEELKGLRAENAALTARVDQLITEQRDQTGAIITATVDSNVTAAQTVVGGVDDSAQTTARAAMLKEEATYV